MISAQYATNTLALIMIDMVIGPAAEYPDFGDNSLTGPGLSARRNAESCHIINAPLRGSVETVYHSRSDTRSEPERGEWKEEYDDENENDGGECEKGREEVGGEGGRKRTYPVWA